VDWWNECWRVFAQVMNRLSRDSDVACRYGGEEFAVIFRNTDTEGAKIVAERMREQIRVLEFIAADEAITVTASIGIGGRDQFADVPEVSSESLLTSANRALYQAKRNGRDRVE
jgi:two-component system, cell cycle response regulator